MMKVVDQHLNGRNCGTEEEEEESEVYHSHCDTCVKIEKCLLQPVESNCCEIISCELNCGFRFHACKEAEHRLLCANEKVPCINVDNGCPVILLRHQRAKHLEICPASVVTCTMEWNRWPVCSQERQMHVPFHLPNPRAKEGQLDIALALRDQRMLNEWMKVPRSTKRILRNSLTSRFPPVPLRSQPCNEGDSSSMSMPTPTPPSDADDDSWEFRKAPPGLQSSVCGELYKTMKGKVNEAAAEASIQLTTKQKVTGNGNISDVINSAKLQNLENNICDIAHENDSANVINGKCSQPLCSGFEEEKISKEHNSICKKNENLDENSLHIKENDKLMGLSGDSEKCSEEWDRNLHVCIIENSRPKGTSSTLVPPPPSSSPPMIVSLGLDLTLESITRYQTKPTNMYTFLCAQDFRRDEFTWHYKNVHSDIHGGLNGWLEYRCPLAHYGCMFSLRRFYPTERGSTIVHNDILESFGVKPHNPCDIAHSVTTESHKLIFNEIFQDGVQENPDDTVTVINTQPLILCQLPFEVLRYLCRFLDSFSLCNLALTCRRLREVCCSLLKERGLVVQQWKKCQIGSNIKWTIAYKRWFFSTAFTPVHNWGFEAKDHMSNHLKNCMCFERNVTSRPYFHIFGSTPKPSLEAKLTSRSAEDDNGTCESVDNLEDIALALRDQRMLNEWMKVPRSTKRILRNSLTSRFPPVPLRSQPCNEGDSSSMSMPTPTPPSDADDDSWEFRKAPPGLQSSVCGELYKTMKGKVNEAAAEASIQLTTKQKVTGNGNISDVINSAKLQNLENNICDIAHENDSANVINGKCSQPLCSGFEEEKISKEHNSICKKNENLDKNSLHIKENDKLMGLSGDSEKCSEEWDRNLHVCIIENSMPKGTSSTLVPPPPSSSPPMIVSLCLDLTLESITRYQTKPTNMYTFLCAQDFRRDEFTWHYKNVHSDIHGGLNGWLEYRCPLAHYGCMFSLRRFYPTERGSTIVHNDILESFGVKPHNPCDIAHSVTTESHKLIFNEIFQDGVKENPDNTVTVINTQPLILCHLPFEVLRYLCRFLDSFSLCNLALTCRRLREVCCSLLKERGLVVQQWKKCQIGSNIKWTIAYKRWFFSTAFTPVHNWGFDAKDHMSNHLKNCMCFERNVTSRPYFHIFGSTPKPSLEAKLTSRSAEDDNGTCESVDNLEG